MQHLSNGAKYSTWHHPYTPAPAYRRRVAYFSMEFAIDQSLKIYSGGLGFLAGSHMRSAYDLQQNLIGIGMLWQYGYYDQVRQSNNHMSVLFQEKHYNFLEDTGIKVTVPVSDGQVVVKAYCLRPETFGTVPVYLLSTDLPENDAMSRSITQRLYDGNELTRVAQSLVLGVGGAKVVDALGGADLYHMNEGHALPLAYYLYNKHGRKAEEVQKRLVFTTHTPEKAGNETHETHLMHVMRFFGPVPTHEAMTISGQANSPMLDYTLAALHLAHRANGVSQLHGEVSRDMWGDYPGICPITSITNAQNRRYWADPQLAQALAQHDDEGLVRRKRELKMDLLTYVANQTGTRLNPDALTIVWARRFAGYKRADLILRDPARLEKLLTSAKQPIQIIWAGKPFPTDQAAVSTFNYLVDVAKTLPGCAVLTGYELELSRLLKEGADVWLNTPRRPREASGTSGMTAAMNGAINFSISDGWMPEFALDGVNSFIIPPADLSQSADEQDIHDRDAMFDILEKKILPLYYQHPDRWLALMKRSMSDVYPQFDADRMADEYYKVMFV
ncbi:MAG: alpha-glucan family phosphorylase [Bernardetiaceae bacterium]|jgi:starch phosphorylase|nr:alpha-glucan family phosphorylase [Bernardetiaceae bacterium]